MRPASAGDSTCARLQGGRLKGWGSNHTGQFGTADRGNRLLPGDVLLDYVLEATSVIEYCNSALDHCFVTLLATEIEAR